MKNDTGEALKGYDGFCHALTEENGQAHLLLWLQDLFLQTCICDPRTGEGRYCDLETFLDRLSGALRSPGCQDRLSRIAEHTAAAIRNLVAGPHEEIRREYRSMPIPAVREVDSVTTIWLSRQPGRTLREKLTGKRSIRALSRRWDLNTSENRLFKAFLQRLQELFEAKARVLGKADPSFLDVEQQAARWLMDESVREIGRWENLPPNNLLLSDKNYRKIWDGWTWLMELDRQMSKDRADINSRMLRMTFWVLAAALHESPGTTFAQLPCLFWMRRLEAEPLWPWNREGLYLEGLLHTREYGLHSFQLALTEGLVFSIPEILRLRFQAQGGNLKTEILYGGKSRIVSKFGSKAVMKVYSLLKSLLTEGNGSVFPKTIEISTVRHCVMNVSALQPGLSLDGERQRLPYRLMGQFWNGDKCGRILLDCGRARGLLLTPETPVITLQNIFSPAGHSEKDVAQAALTFFEKIHATIRCRRLHYIIPDNLEDFSLSAVRRQIKLYFPDARPLPRSIGAIFAFQRACPQKFHQYERVLVLVGSLCGTQLLITPLIGYRDSNLNRLLPEAGGFRWERHPSHAFDDSFLRDSVARILSWDEHNPLSMINIQPLDICDLAGNVTLYTRDGETLKDYVIPAKSSRKMADLLSRFRIDTRRLMDVRKQVSGNKSIPCFFLPADCPLRYHDHVSDIISLEKVDSVEGGTWIAAWEDRPGCPVLWKDHLPELYMQASSAGSPVYLPLVKEGAVRPQYGQMQKINTVEFSLPQGADFYHFPLTKSKGGTKFRYEAQIRSPSFPLREDVPCTLEMCYTYGAENPYQLFVLPRNKKTAPFQRIEVEWVRADEIVRRSPVPPVPAPCSWQELRHFQGKNGKSSDIIDWMEKEFSFIHYIVCFYRDGSSTYSEGDRIYERVYIEDFSSRTAPWKKGLTGQFTFITIPDGRSIYVNEKVLPPMEEFRPQDIREVSFDIIRRKNDPTQFLCGNMSPGKSINIQDLKKKIRFPSLQIWRDGRSLADAEAPESLREAVRIFHEDLEYLTQHDNLDSVLKEECLLCAARMHKDTPGRIWKILRDIAEDERRTFTENVMLGSALGDFSLPQQRELHNILLDACEKKPWRLDYFGILALAYWCCPSTVSLLTEQEINRLIKALLRAFHGQLEKNEDKLFPQNSTKLCELLLALLRTRDSDVPEIRKILDANGVRCKKLTELVEKIIEIQRERKFCMDSLVQLKMEKPDSRKAMPDILYAVHMYLTGEDGTDDIVITGVDEVSDDNR